MKSDQRRIEMLVERIPSDAERILDVGCVRHDGERRDRGNLHAQLHREYPDAEIVGVDLPGEATRAMQEQGYDVRGVDCQTMDLGERFDAIVAGELIEHLPNPGQFLTRVGAHLTPDGKAILSTPNPNCVYYQSFAVLGKWTSDEHTCWISPYQLDTLVEYADTGLSVCEVSYVEPEMQPLATLWRGNKRLSAPNYIATLA